jgi:hypothetical protein
MDILREDLEAQYNDPKDQWKIDRDFRQKRKFMVAHCESMARARVIRKLLNIKQEYTAEELRKPFVLVRFRINIDYSDPEIKLLTAKAHIMASVGIFGNPPDALLPAPEPPIITPQEAAILNQEPETPPVSVRQPEAPTAGQQLTKEFFESLQRPDQESEILKLMDAKAYDRSRLKCDVSEFSSAHLMNFFDALSAMPNANHAPY